VTLIDISVPIHPRMHIYEGNPGVRLDRVLSIGEGEAANVSCLELGCHTGTHLDAPLHFIEGAAAAEEIPLDSLVGEAVVVDATALEGPIDAQALESCSIAEGAERVLLKTRNGELWARDEFTHDFVRLDRSGAHWLVDRGVRLIGLDYLSIGDEDAHRVLLGAGVVPLEGLDLRHVEPGRYELLCLPLRVVGSDGAPARALLRRL
jgi:arylformamidase